MRHGPCGTPVAPNQAWCDRCLGPIIWPSDVIEDSPVKNPGAPAADDGIAAPVPHAVKAPSASVPCSCGRSHPAGTSSCPFGGTMARIAPLVAALTLPGGERVMLGPEPLVLGRTSPDARIARILDPFDGVSRRHAVLRLEGAAVWLADAGSTNGTWIAGRRLELEERLPPGDTRVELGTSGLAFVTVHAP